MPWVPITSALAQLGLRVASTRLIWSEGTQVRRASPFLMKSRRAPVLRCRASRSALTSPRAIALDLDGTLFTSSGQVSNETCTALRAFVEHGGVAMIATGRGRSTAVRVACELEAQHGIIIRYIVCSEGALALQRAPRSDSGVTPDEAWCVLWTGMRPGSAYPLGALRAALPGASFAAEVDGLGGFIIDSEQYIDTIRSRSPGFAQRFLAGRQATPDFDHVFGASERIGWLRALPENATEADADALCERVADALTATAPGSDLQVTTCSIVSLRSLGALTISTRGTDKSSGLAAATAACGINAADVLAFGDHDNDLAMFAWAGQSVCPANANGNAKAAATWRSHLSNDEDFIGDALRGLGFGA